MPTKHPSYREAVIAVLDEVAIITLLIIFILYELDKYNIINLYLLSYSLIIIILPILLIISYIIYLVLKSQIQPPKVGLESLIGVKGKVIDTLNPEGTIIVNGEYWRARTISGETASSGATVIVRGKEGSLLLVEVVDNKLSVSES